MPDNESEMKTTKDPRAHKSAEKLENDCLLGRIVGTKARGRQQSTYMDSFLGFLGGGQTTARVFRLARERRNWRSRVDNITR